MIEYNRAKMIPALIVDLDGEIIQQVNDYLVMSKKSSVRLMVVNGRAVGLDTATPSSRVFDEPLTITSEKGRTRKPASPDISVVTQAKVLEISAALVEKGEAINAQAIGDQLQGGQPVRSKVSRMLKQLVAQGVLKRTGDRSQTVYSLTRKGNAAKERQARTRKQTGPTMPPKAAATQSVVFSEDDVLKRVQAGDRLSMTIANNLGISPQDSRSRVQVTALLNRLLAQGKIEKIGVERGIMPIYAVKAMAEAE